MSVASALSPGAVWLASLSLGLSRALQSSRDSIPVLHSLRLWLPQPVYSEAANYIRQCVCVSLAWTQPNVLASCAGPGVSPPASQTLQMKPWERWEKGWMVFSLTSAAWCFKSAPNSQQVSSTLWSACFCWRTFSISLFFLTPVFGFRNGNLVNDLKRLLSR